MGIRPKKADTATEADWSFLDEPLIIEGIAQAVAKLVRVYWLEFDDVSQDACLWVSVRPQMVSMWLEKGDVRRVRADIYSALSKANARAAKHNPFPVPYEEVFVEGEP